MPSTIRRFCASVIATAIVATAAGQNAQAAVRYHFDVPEQPLGDAIRALASQADTNVMFDETLLKGHLAQRLQMEGTLDEALNRVLAGTGLSARWLNERTVVVASPSDAPSAMRRSAGGGAAESLQDSSQSLSDSQIENAVGVQQGETAREGQAQPDSPKRDYGTLEEIVVTGTSISGVRPESSPLSIYGYDYIRNSGAVTVEQFIAKLPENLGSLSGIAPNAVSLSGRGNRQAVSGVDLRGLGVGATLVLLNGHRLPLASAGRTPDISLVPLEALERVDVLADGASAIYGSDAVAGVVNLVLRRNLDGADTRLSYGGVTSGGATETKFDQLYGRTWNTGSALVAYNILDRSELDAGDRSFSEAAAPFSLIPDEKRHNGLVTFSQELGAGMNLSGDLLYSQKEVRFASRLPLSGNVVHRGENEERQWFSTLELTKDVGRRLKLSTSVTYGRLSDEGSAAENRTPTPYSQTTEDLFRSVVAETKLDGAAVTLPGGELRFSVGAGYGTEKYSSAFATNEGVDDFAELDRSTKYGFAELSIPVVGDANARPFIRRLILNVAGRFTDYSDFGSKVSPKFGFLWKPADALGFRGTYSRSFRAPPLSQLDPNGNFYGVFHPNLLGVPDIWSTDGSTVLLFAQGSGNPGLGAENARSYTFGIDVTPSAVLSGAKIGATYFDISYRERILAPDPTGTTALFSPSEFQSIYDLNPSEDMLRAVIRGAVPLFNSTPVDATDPAALASVVTVLLDNRVRNLALSNVKGVDFSVDFKPESANGLAVGGHLSYLMDYDQSAFEGSPTIDVVRTVFNPARVKARAYAGVGGERWYTQLSVNYVGSSTNNIDPEHPRVASWTTLDAAASFEFGEGGSALTRGLKVTFSAQNLLDKDPPAVALGSALGQGLLAPIGFDPMNASPLGRFVSLQLSKKW